MEDQRTANPASRLQKHIADRSIIAFDSFAFLCFQGLSFSFTPGSQQPSGDFKASAVAKCQALHVLLTTPAETTKGALHPDHKKGVLGDLGNLEAFGSHHSIAMSSDSEPSDEVGLGPRVWPASVLSCQVTTRATQRHAIRLNSCASSSLSPPRFLRLQSRWA